jgi:hypothetical protein
MTLELLLTECLAPGTQAPTGCYVGYAAAKGTAWTPNGSIIKSRQKLADKRRSASGVRKKVSMLLLLRCSSSCCNTLRSDS